MKLAFYLFFFFLFVLAAAFFRSARAGGAQHSKFQSITILGKLTYSTMGGIGGVIPLGYKEKNA